MMVFFIAVIIAVIGFLISSAFWFRREFAYVHERAKQVRRDTERWEAVGTRTWGFKLEAERDEFVQRYLGSKL